MREHVPDLRCRLRLLLPTTLACDKMEHTVTSSWACSAHTKAGLRVARLATGRATREWQNAKRHRHVQGSRTYTVDSRAQTSSSATSAEQKIRIKLKAFELPLLKESVSHILQAAESTGQACAGVT